MNPSTLPRTWLPKRARRHKKLRDNLMGITRPAIRRLARRGGVIRIKADIYEEIRKVIRMRITEVLRQVVHLLESASTNRTDRKVITTRDIVYVLNRMGNTLYGFSETLPWTGD